jgi:hypothetical protein
MNCQVKDCPYSNKKIGSDYLSVLSYHDERKKIGKNKMPLTYTRTTKWRCPNLHITTSTMEIDAADLKIPVGGPTVDRSYKRFHRKGYTGHVVNPPTALKDLPTFPPDITNHRRMVARKFQRDQQREQIREQRAKLAEVTAAQP